MHNFIKDRLNKDNFWNLMFALILFMGSFSGFLVGGVFGGIIFLISFVSGILLVKNNSPIDFDKEKLVFITSRGKKIRKLGVLFIWLLISSKVIAMGLVALLLDPGTLFWEIFFPMSFFLPEPLLFFDEDILLNKLLFVFSFSIFPSLYCILRNFPISVYFKKEAWIADSTDYNSSIHRSHSMHDNTSMHSSHSYHNTSSNPNNYRSIVTEPSYRYLSCNIYHKR